MDALQGLVANVPDWVKRLDELNSQIERRQLDLASVGQSPPTSSARSMKNKGSTESLRPNDDGPAFLGPDPDNEPFASPQSSRPTPPDADGKPPSSPVSDRKTPSSIQRQTNDVMLAAQQRARAVLRRRQKTESMITGDGFVPTYRSRNMIIVYYDSYVQSFFEELVRFVSATRNMMRKAKMAAKVAQIKRLAELEMPDDDDDDEDEDEDGGDMTPSDSFIAASPIPGMPKPRDATSADIMLRYSGTHGMEPALRAFGAGPLALTGALRRPGLAGALSSSRESSLFGPGAGDVYDTLDKNLEFVQSMCENAAHQFLRDGECTDEIDKIQKRLLQVKESSAKEMERSLKEDGPVPKDPEPPKTRNYRPMSMRRDFGALSPTKREPVEKVVEQLDDEGIHDMGDLEVDDKPVRPMQNLTAA